MATGGPKLTPRLRAGLRDAISAYRSAPPDEPYTAPECQDLRASDPPPGEYPRLPTKDRPDFPSKLGSPLVNLPRRAVKFIITGRIDGEVDDSGASLGYPAVPAKIRRTYHTAMRNARLFCKYMKKQCKGLKVAPFHIATKHMIEVTPTNLSGAQHPLLSKIARHAADLEVQQIARASVAPKSGIRPTDESGGALPYINRVRAKWSMMPNLDTFEGVDINAPTDRVAVYKWHQDQRVTYLRNDRDAFVWFEGAKITVFIDLIRKTISCESSPFANLIYSEMEIFNNLSRMRELEENTHAYGMIDFMRKLHLSRLTRETKVATMKSMETLLLMKADMSGTRHIHWLPIVDAVAGHWDIFSTAPIEDYNLLITIQALYTGAGELQGPVAFVESLKVVQSISGKDALEVSALHKGAFYASIDERKGVHKFAKRTCSKRKVDPEAALELVHSFRRKFMAGFGRRHHKLPPFTAPQNITSMLLEMANRKDWDSIEAWPLQNLRDVILGKAIDGDVPKTALNYAKDSSRLMAGAFVGSGSTNNEIEEVISQIPADQDCTLPQLPKNDTEPSFELHHSDRIHLSGEYVVKLSLKDREQKLEGRLHGSTTVANKIGVSIMSEKDMKVLSYLSGNLVTPGSSERKKLIHKAAQLLLRDGYYCYMADFEGHNQSMQEAACDPVAAEFARVLGEEEGSNHARIFRHLQSFYLMTYEDEAYVIRHQYGGIEGWENAFWTAMSCLIIDSARDSSPLRMPEDRVYSDDVVALVQATEEQESLIPAYFKHMSDHARKFGHRLKMSQCAFSKVRMTMLRVHYHQGLIADATLKRLCSVSSMTESLFFNETREMSAISSTTSSALSQSNHPYTVFYLKHFHAVALTYKSFTTCVTALDKNSSLEPQYFSPQLRAGISQKFLRMIDDASHKHTEVWAEDKLRQLRALPHMKQKDAVELLEQELKTIIQLGVEMNSKEAMEHLVLSEISGGFSRTGSNAYLLSVYLMCIFSPAQFGGRGLELGLYQSMSGHSISVARVVDMLLDLLSKSYVNPGPMERVMTSAFTAEDVFTDFDGEISVLNSHFPAKRKIWDITSMIEQKVKEKLRSLPRHPSYDAIFDTVKTEKELHTVLLNLFRHRMHCRVTSMFLENSALRDFESLVKKIETGRSIFSKSGNMDYFIRKSSNHNRTTLSSLLRRRESDIGSLAMNEDCIAFFERRRKKMFPNITFIEISEPTYECITIWGAKQNIIASAGSISDTTFASGYQEYRVPDTEARSDFKGVKEFTHLNFSTVHAQRIYKLATNVKWMLCASGHGTILRNELRETAVFKAFIYVLQMYGCKAADEMFLLGEVAEGGEVLHRLEGDLFRALVNLHVLPNVCAGLTACVRTAYLSKHQLTDSNINLAFLQKRAKAAMAYRVAYGIPTPPILTIGLINSPTLRDVRVDWSGGCTEGAVPIPRPIINADPSLEDRTRMALKSRHAPREDDTLAEGPLAASEFYDAEQLDSGYDLERDILMYYVLLKREDLSNYPLFGSPAAWKPLFARLRKKEVELSIQEGESEEENFCRLMQVVERVVTSALPRIESFLYENRPTEPVGLLMSKLREICVEAGGIIQEVFEACDIFIDRKASLATYMGRMIKCVSRLDETIELRDRALEVRDCILLYCVICKVGCFRFSPSAISIDREKTQQMKDFASVSASPKNFSGNTVQDTFILLSVIPPAQHSPEVMHHVFNRLDVILGEVEIGSILPLPKVQFDPDPGTLITSIPNIDPSFKYHIGPRLQLADADPSISDSMIDYVGLVARLFSPLDSFASPTGSDAYVAQYGLFNALKTREGRQPLPVCGNFCAGRGDGAIVARQLGIEMESFSRRSLFSAFLNDSDVTIDETLDIADPDFLALAMTYRWGHYDISFLADKHCAAQAELPALYDNIAAAATHVALTTVRINSLDQKWLLEMMRVLAESCEFRLAWPVSRKYCPNHIYLIIYNREVYGAHCSEGPVASLNNIMKSIREPFSRLVNWGNFINSNSDEAFNSSAQLLSRIPSLLDVIQGGNKMDYIGAEMLGLRDLQTSAPLLERVPLPPSDDADASWTTNIRHKVVGKTDALSVWAMMQDDAKSTSRSKQVSAWARQRSLICPLDDAHAPESVELPHVDLWLLEDSELEQISRYHPMKLIRKSSISMTALNDMTAQANALDKRELLRSHLEEVKTPFSVTGPRLQSMSLALECIAYAVIKEDRQLLYKLVAHTSIHSSRMKKRASRLLTEARRLSFLFDYWEPGLVPHMVRNRFLAHFEEGTMGPIRFLSGPKNARSEAPVAFDKVFTDDEKDQLTKMMISSLNCMTFNDDPEPGDIWASGYGEPNVESMSLISQGASLSTGLEGCGALIDMEGVTFFEDAWFDDDDMPDMDDFLANDTTDMWGPPLTPDGTTEPEPPDLP